MDLNQVNKVLSNQTKHDVFFNERVVWIQDIDTTNNLAKVGFVDNFEETDVKLDELYEKN